MRERFSSMLPWLLIGGGTFIIQWHSIAFWTEHVNASIGWVWSIVIEAGSLWLWYRPNIASRMLGLAASVLLLAGPLYQIGGQAIKANERSQIDASKHAIAEVQYKSEVSQYKLRQAAAKDVLTRHHEATAQTAQMVRAQIAQDAQLLLTYARNSKKRTGWLPAIEKLQRRMDTERARLAGLNKQLETVPDVIHIKAPRPPEYVVSKGFSVVLLVLLQAFGLTLIQVTNILAITYVSKKMRARTISAPYVRGCADNAHLCAEQANMEDNCLHDQASAHPSAQDRCATLRAIARNVRGWMDHEHLSIASAAMRLGVGRQDLSYLMRWKTTGDRKPPDGVIEKIREVIVQQEAAA